MPEAGFQPASLCGPRLGIYMIDTAMVSWTSVYFLARFAEGTKLRHTYHGIPLRLFLNQNGAQFWSTKSRQDVIGRSRFETAWKA